MQAAEEQDKVVRFYDQFAEKQEKTGINSRHLSILDKVKKAGLQAQHRILEVGCGIGTVSHLLATQVPQGEVLAVDISPESIEKARVLWKKQGNLKFDVSDMSDFNLPGKTFDFFVFPDVLEHIPDDTKAMKELYRVLKPGGMAILQIPQDLNRTTTFSDDSITDEKERARIFGQYDHVRIYGLDYFDKLRSVGFTVVEEDYTKKISPELVTKYCLAPGEIIPVCFK